MSAIDKFVKMFNQIIDRRSDQWMERIPAQLGDYAGQVTTGTAGMINVRTTEGQNLVVFNNVAPAEADIWVTIGRSKDQPQLWQVISRREVWDVPGSSSVVHHHEQHMFDAPDEVPIDRRQILQLSVRVYDPAGFIVRVGGSYVPTASGIRMIATQLVDLSSYVVTEGAKFVAIESDDEGVLTVNEGVAFAAPDIGTVADIPTPDPGKYHVASVLFYEGQAALSNAHIRVPFPLGIIAKSSGLQIDEAAADTPLDADKFGFWDVVDDVLKSITWANIKATLKTYFDTLYATIAHTHEVDQRADMFDDAEGDPADTHPTTPADGISTYASRRDHVHKGAGGAGVVSGPQAFGDNYVITPSVATNDLTVALKTVAGADPSAGDPITIRIGNTKRTITAALSVTKNDGTNWCNAGGTELAGKDIDFFVYLIQETGASAGTKIGFSRIPYARTMADFVNTTTNEKYIPGSWTNFNATDEVENIGRFRAQLSATAAHNWSMPTSVVINRPIDETDWLTWQPAYTSIGTVTTVVAKYKLRGYATLEFELRYSGTISGSPTGILATVPFEAAQAANSIGVGPALFYDVSSSGFGGFYISAGTPDQINAIKYNFSAFANNAGSVINGNGFYEI